MRLFLLLLFIFLSGCSSLDSFYSKADKLINPKSEKEKFSEKVDAWSDQKIEAIVSSFEGGFPVYKEDGMQPIPKDKIDEFYERSISKIDQLKSQFKENKKSMKRLHRIKGKVDATSNHLNRIRSQIFTQIDDYARDFEDAVVQNATASKYEYCENNNYIGDNNNYSDRSCDGADILKRIFFDKKPEYKKYVAWLESTKNELNSLSEDINRQGLSYETRQFLEKASSGECSNLEGINFYGNVPMRHKMCHADFRPDKQSVYQLRGLKVVQSVSDGVILSSSNRSCPYPRTVFLDTDETYPDNYVFQSKGSYACATGTKDFTSVLGAKKRITSFKAINDNDRYYFFPVSKKSQ